MLHKLRNQYENLVLLFFYKYYEILQPTQNLQYEGQYLENNSVYFLISRIELAQKYLIKPPVG